MNQIQAIIQDVKQGNYIALVSAKAQGHLWQLMLLEYKDAEKKLMPGREVVLAFKETELILFKERNEQSLSLINQIPCSVEKIRRGDFLDKITLRVGSLLLKGVFLGETMERMSLKKGDELFFSVKTNEISLLY